MRSDLNRIDYLKHYTGSPAKLKGIEGKLLCIDEDENNVNFIHGEDDVIHVNCDPESVIPSLKTFSDLNESDLNKIIDSIVFNTQEFSSVDFELKKDDKKSYFRYVKKHNGEDFIYIVIRPNWSIQIVFVEDSFGPFSPDNYPEIVFLLCKLGYDVTGYFSK